MIRVPTEDQYYKMLYRWLNQFKGRHSKTFERTDSMWGRKFSPICVVTHGFK